MNDLIEEALGAARDGKRAAALLDQLLEGIHGSGDPDSAKDISTKLKRGLRVKHAAR